MIVALLCEDLIPLHQRSSQYIPQGNDEDKLYFSKSCNLCLWIKDALLQLERLYKKYWQEKEAKFKVMIAQQTCFQTWLCPLFSYTNLLSLVRIGKVLWATQQRRSVLVMNRKNEALHFSFFLVLYTRSIDKTIKMQSDAKFC